MIENEWITGNRDPEIAYEIRKKVFVDEQHCNLETDRDAYDEQAVHLVVYVDAVPAATGRIYHDGKHFRIGRYCVLKEFRGQGIGDLTFRLLLYKALLYANEVHIGAQTYLEDFYRKFGFEKNGEEYMEENIPHINMTVQKEKCVFPSACKEKEK